MATRDGTAEWRGTLTKGAGTVSVASGIIHDGRYSFASRFEDEPGTNPEELIAAAHAGCFSMALARQLTEAGHAPESVRTTARVHLRQVEGAATIAQIDLVTEGAVAGIDQQQFAELAAKAKAGCPVSRALAGVRDITLQATLASADSLAAANGRSAS
jgi:osmotically inducible protein OsmC